MPFDKPRAGSEAYFDTNPIRGLLRLAKHIFYFAEQRSHHGLVVHFRRRLQFLKELFLALTYLGGNLHAHFHVEIALAVSIEHWHALVADTKRCAGLGSVGNLESVLTFEGGDADFCAHRGLRDGDRNDAMQI